MFPSETWGWVSSRISKRQSCLLTFGLGGGEEVEVEQVQADRGAQFAIVLASAQLSAEGARQVEQPAFVPGAVAADLDLDIVAMALGIPGEDVEDDVFAAELAGLDVGTRISTEVMLGRSGRRSLISAHSSSGASAKTRLKT